MSPAPEHTALGLAVVNVGQHVRRLKRQQRQLGVLILVETPLLVAHVVVLGVGLDGGLAVIPQDVGLQEDQEVGLGLLGIAGAKQLADDRDVAEQRYRAARCW